jgi:hypothetical protein
MKPSHQQHIEFLSGGHLPGLSFRHNDRVQVVGGAHAGIAGNLISVEALGDDPQHLVELDSGQDVNVAQSALKPQAA